MIVLGKNNADKGKQFERLAGRVLKELGYTHLRFREIGLGGMELDITGRYALPVPGKSTFFEIVGECKAHRDPVATIDWLKLIGKLHIRQKETGRNVNAVLLSLSGYNGNVVGAYESYQNASDDVHLIEPEAFEETVVRLFEVCDLSVVANALNRFTPEAPTRFEMAYYDGVVIWTVEFDDRRVAYFSASGEQLDEAKLLPIHKMYVSQFGRFALVDLNREGEALRRRRLAAKVQMAALFLLGGSAPTTTLFADPDFTESEHNSGFAHLLESSLVVESNGSTSLSFLTSPDHALAFARTVAFWLTDKVPLAYVTLLLGSSLYEKSIDVRMVEYARTVQGDLPIPIERTREAIEWMQLSPSALLNALSPQQMIVQHRLVNPLIQPNIDEYDVRWFFNMLIDSFILDFHNQPLSAFYFLYGIHEVEQLTAVRIKGPGGVRNVERHPSRSLIAPLDDSVGGTFVLISAIDSMEEPGDANNPVTPDVTSNLRRATADKAVLYGVEPPALRSHASMDLIK